MQQILIRHILLPAVISIFGMTVLSCGFGCEDDALVFEDTGWPSECSEGYKSGVSAPFCGIYDGMFLLAGGANFPHVPASEGGRKVFYSDIFLLGTDGWTFVGELPSPMAYGGCLKVEDRLICVGGSNGIAPVADVFSFRTDCGKVLTEALTPLPTGIEQAGYSVSGPAVFVAGGISADGMNMNVYKGVISGSEVKWTVVATLPEPLVQPILFCSGEELYVWGGFDPVSKIVSSNGWRLHENRESWIPVPGPSDYETLTGASATVLPDGRLAVIGGVDNKVFSRGLSAEGADKYEYMTMSPADYKFSRRLRIFDPQSESWTLADEVECLALAGAGVASENWNIYVAGGEIKPGVRTPHSWKIELHTK